MPQSLNNAEYESVTTDDAFNSTIGDNVDYLDPRWLARWGGLIAHLHSWPSGIEIYATATSGSGNASVSGEGGELQVRTNSTDDSKARILGDWGMSGVKRSWDWGKDAEFVFDAKFARNLSEGMYVMAGRVDEGALTNNHIGFGINSSGNLVATNADGSTQNASDTGVSVSANDAFRLRAVLTAGTDIEFFVDGTSQVTHSSNLPTGTSGNPEEFTLLAFNAVSGGSDGDLRCGDLIRVQMS